jgi:hypothetical protein
LRAASRACCFSTSVVLIGILSTTKNPPLRRALGLVRG